MQVFVPYPSPIDTARAMSNDKLRLRKQVTECCQILDAIDGKSQAWKNHPVTKMYAPFREWLDRYRICLRHFINGDINHAGWWSRHADLVRPDFITPEFCDQHKRRLYTKDPNKYPQFADLGTTEENWYVIDGELVKYVDGKRV